MTQKALAQAIGCEPSYISHIERISRSLSIRHLFQIADAMKTTPAFSAYKAQLTEEIRAEALKAVEMQHA